MLEYSHPSAAHRPGIIIAVGVISILIGCISGLANLSGAFSGMVFMMMSRVQTPATPAPAPATTAPTPTAGGPVATATFGGFDTIPAALSIVTSVLGLALALYLLVAGIFMLRASQYAVRLHWWYVWLKIPLVIATTAVTVWMWSGLMKSMLATMPPSAPGAPAAAATMQSWMMHITTFIGALLSLAYPIALIFVLRSRTVRNYFNAVHA